MMGNYHVRFGKEALLYNLLDKTYLVHFIIETSFGQFLFIGFISFYFAVISAIFTTLYTFKLLYYTFLIKPNGSYYSKIQKDLGDENGSATVIHYSSIHDSPPIMSLPLIPLALASIFFGYLFRDLFIGLGTNFWDYSLFTHPNHLSILEAEFHSLDVFRFLVLSIILIGFILTYFSLSKYNKVPWKGVTIKMGIRSIAGNTNWDIIIPSQIRIRLSNFLFNAYWFNHIYNFTFLYPIFYLGLINYKQLDRGILELLGPYGLVISFKSISNHLYKMDSAYIPHYALYFLSASILILWFSDSFQTYLFLLLLTLIIPFTR